MEVNDDNSPISIPLEELFHMDKNHRKLIDCIKT